jgi:hypothetical protein
MGDYYRLGRLCPFLTTNGDTPFGVVLEQDPLGTYMGKLVPPPPILMSLNPNINSDLAVGAVITEFLVARALHLDPLISRRHCLRFEKKLHFRNQRPRNRGGTKIFTSIWYNLLFLVLSGRLYTR